MPLVIAPCIDSITIHDPIVMPDIAYLIGMPFFNVAPYDFVMSYGAKFQKSLLTRAPLRGNRKNVLVTSRVNLIYPGFSPTSNRLGNTFEWHVDGSGSVADRFAGDNDIFHVIVSDCESRTEFLAVDQMLNTDDFSSVFDVAAHLNRPGVEYNAGKIPAEQFVTFTNKHIHRATQCPQPEFRFFMNITESDRMEAIPREKWLTNESLLYQGEREFLNIRKSKDRIEIFEPKEGVVSEVYSKGIPGNRKHV